MPRLRPPLHPSTHPPTHPLLKVTLARTLTTPSLLGTAVRGGFGGSGTVLRGGGLRTGSVGSFGGRGTPRGRPSTHGTSARVQITTNTEPSQSKQVQHATTNTTITPPHPNPTQPNSEPKPCPPNPLSPFPPPPKQTVPAEYSAGSSASGKMVEELDLEATLQAEYLAEVGRGGCLFGPLCIPGRGPGRGGSGRFWRFLRLILVFCGTL
jgi:hypothetical protein